MGQMQMSELSMPIHPEQGFPDGLHKEICRTPKGKLSFHVDFVVGQR